MGTRARWFLVLAFAAALLYGVSAAVQRLWICDDAFISFRYAENLVAGHGLVFNVGERVEGYTNFLWTLLCACAVACGLDVVRCAQVIGIVCFAATGLVLCRAGKRLVQSRDGFLPLAAIGFLLHRHAQEFASCGLETALFTLLVTCLALVLATANDARAWLLAGMLAVLAGLTRPDGAIFGLLAGLGALFASVRARCRGPVLAYALPGLLVFVPFLCWRYWYYGDLLPNTFYAKSGNDPYPAQGLYYCWLFFSSYWVLVPALLSTPVLLWRGSSATWLSLFVLAYTAFVIWVGGDFMFARFLMPVTPLLYLLLEWLARRWLSTNLQVVAVIAVAAATLGLHEHVELRGVRSNLRGIGDEREQYPPERVAEIRSIGTQMGQLFARAPVRVAFFGTQAMLVHEAKFSYALEGSTGLTDRHLAHQQLRERGIPGHEKSLYADPQYALQQRLDFLLERYGPYVDSEPYRGITFFGRPMTIVIYHRELMARLRGARGVEFQDFEHYLDDYLAALPGKTKAAVSADLGRFRLFYFQWNEDRERLARLEDFVAGR